LVCRKTAFRSVIFVSKLKNIDMQNAAHKEIGIQDENRLIYSMQLKSQEWQRKRDQVLLRDNKKCRNCGSQTNLQIHHRQYHTIRSSGKFKKPWDYNLKYLITLCNDCHEKGHQKFRVPIFKV